MAFASAPSPPRRPPCPARTAEAPEQTDGRQEGANVIDEGQTRAVGERPQQRRADAP